MKKKLLSIMAIVMATAMLVGCGKDAEQDVTEQSGTESSTSLEDLKAEDYVTLGEYKGMEVVVYNPEVDLAQVEELMYSTIQNSITAATGITDRAIENGDVANIDYIGKKDGVAFEGGTATGYNLAIGSGNFIAGFEEGLVGVKPGETVDLELTFPENYHSADLAGQKVVFTVKVNFIMPTEITDELVAGLGIENVTTQDQLYDYVYDYLYALAQEDYDAALKNTVLETFIASNTYAELPEELLAKYEETSRQNIQSVAESYGMDLDTFTNTFYGMDFESFVDAYCEDAVKQDLALKAVANAENLNIPDDELDARLLEYALAAGYLTVEEYIGDTDKEEFREYFLYDKVLAYLVESATVTTEVREE